MDGLPARALDDPRLPMPHLRRLIEQGAVAKAMVPINPTVTWPNHTTLVTGVDASVHHVMANGLIALSADGGSPEVKPWVPKDELVHAPTLYDAAAASGLTTGQVDWVAIYGAKSVTWAFGEKPDPASPIARDLVEQKLVTEQQLQQFNEGSSPAWRDQVWTDAAVDILARHKPDFLMVHLLETDTLQHQYGPLTPAAFAAYAFADACLGRILEAAQAAGTAGQTTFIVTADHGFAASTHTIRPNVLLAQLGLAGRNVQVLAEGGAAEVFAPHTAGGAGDLAKLRQALSALPGIREIAEGGQLQALGLPAPGSTDQAPAMYLAAAPGYAFAGDTRGPVVESTPVRGQHGYGNDDPDMGAMFVASGAHIRPGTVLPAFSNLRVAPTLAKLLHIALPTAAAKPLDEMLR